MIEITIHLKERGDGTVIVALQSAARCTARELEVLEHFKAAFGAALKTRPHPPKADVESIFLVHDPNGLLDREPPPP